MQKSNSATPNVVWVYGSDDFDNPRTIDQLCEIPEGKDIYWLPAQSKNGRRKKGDIQGSVWIMADLDPPKTVWIDEQETAPGALDAWRAEALPKLEAHEPRFNLIVDSGRGFQVGYYLSRQCGHDEVEAARYALAKDIGGDHTHDISRVMRLWGTVNQKTKRPTAIIRWEPEPPHDIESLPAEEPPVRAGKTVIDAEVELNPDLDAIAEKYFPNDPTLKYVIQFGEHSDENLQYKSRSEAVWYVVNGLVRAKVPDSTILGILLDERNKISHSMYYMKKGGKFIRRRDPEKWARKELGDVDRSAKPTKGLVVDEDGKPYKTPNNFIIGLGVLGITVRYNEFADSFVVAGLEHIDTQLSDPIMTEVRVMFSKKWGWYPGKDFTRELMQHVGHHNKFHPVKDYFESLTWDGVSRIETWLHTCGGVKDTPYTRAVSSMSMIATVRRIYQPGAKFDTMLVLESAQGWNKSGALKVLAIREEWFTDKPPLGADSKQLIEDTRGKLIIEFAELQGMSKSDVDKMKSSLSRQVDRARPSYGTIAVDVPRQFTNWATTNNQNYLRDLTGNRRFWPLALGKAMDLDWLRAHRDQLWAEAVMLHKQGASITLAPELWAEAAQEQKARRVESSFAGIIQEYLGHLTGRISETSVWNLLNVPTVQQDSKITQMRADMAEAGFEYQTRLRFGNGHRYPGFVKGETKAEQVHQIKVERRNGEVIVTVERASPQAYGKAVSDDCPF